MILGIMGSKDKSEAHGKDAVYASSVMYDLANSFNNASTITNDLESLKTYFENENCDIDSYTRTIQYLYNVPLNIYAKNADGKYQKSDIMEVFSGMSEGSTMENSMGSMSEMYGSFSSFNSWAELLPGTNGAPVSDMISDQYELVAGSWPTKKEHIILVLDSNNEITDITLHALALKSTDKIIADMIAAEKGEQKENPNPRISISKTISLPEKHCISGT
jgi:putative ABC transport system permease protein